MWSRLPSSESERPQSQKTGGRSWNPFKHKSKEVPSDKQESLTIATTINAIYYPNWRVYRSQPPSSLNLTFITHIFYAFARLTDKATISFTDGYADTEIDINGTKGCINDLRSIKQKHPYIKTILSIGGGGEGSKPFPAVANNGFDRYIFAQNARQIVDAYGLDGIDIDWEHPANLSQGRHYVEMLAALRKELPAPQYSLTSALPAGEWALRNIDLRRASTNLDLINLMTYDFSGPWTKFCGHQSQLYSPRIPRNDAAKVSCDSAVSYLFSQGVASHKILLGIPAYGRSFLGANGPGSLYNGQGGEEGTFEYRDLPRPGAAVHYDEDVTAVYCFGGDGGFVTYDDPRTVRAKADYAKQKNLGGLFYWTGTGDRNDPGSLVEAGYRALHSSE